MKSVLMFAGSIFVVVSVFATNEFGDLKSAQKGNPAVFVPGNVVECTVGGVLGYAYNGEAERCFAGNMAESDSELYQEAVLDAKNNLYKFLAKGDSGWSVQMYGAQKIYEYIDGKMRRVVMFIPKGNVLVHRSGMIAETALDKTSAAPVVVTSEKNDRDGVRPVVDSRQRSINSSEDVVVPPVANVSETEALLDGYLKALEVDPHNCIAMNKAAKIYSRRGDGRNAGLMYSNIVKTVVADERMDGEFATGLLMEAARFAKESGDVSCALKYYRLVIRCDGMRHWGLPDQVEEANANISQLLLKEH